MTQILVPALPIFPIADDTADLNELQESMCINANILPPREVIDLPLSVDEAGVLSIIDLN